MSEPATKQHQTLRLPDGRLLGFAEFGDPQGAPLLYCHGWPSSRLEPATVQPLLTGLPVRVIAPDRPGYGLSGLQESRTISDWPKDVLHLMDHLNVQRFSVLGISGGGPYAAACAALIPDRLMAVGLACSLGPLDAPETTEGMVALNRWLLAFARHTPWLAQKVGAYVLQSLWGKGEQVIPRQIEERLPPADRQALSSQPLREALIASSKEALRCGVEGAARDGFLYAHPWGFQLRDIRLPIHLWHGEKDIVVPPAMGHYLAAHLPACIAEFLPEDGHFSLPFTKIREILGALIKNGS